MNLKNINAGIDVPSDCWGIIEISDNESCIKYEVDKETGMLLVDRFLNAPVNFPCNYGYIPKTLGLDNDPIDILLLSPNPIISGTLIRCRPIGVLLMEDEKGEDSKILMVPHQKLTTIYNCYKDISDIPNTLLLKIEFFFSNYKKLDNNKWVKIIGWNNKETAEKLILEACERYKSNQ